MTAPLADLQVEHVGQIVVARVDGEIDMSNAHDVGDAIARQLPHEAQGLVLDLGAVSYVDSAGIRVIYELRERLQARGHELRLAVGPDTPITEALRVADVTGTIATFPTLEEALASPEG
jgi:anti-anti-sigma factor